MKEFDHKKDWFYEGNISRRIVEYLKNKNYEIIKDNSNNIKAKGVDIIAKKNNITELIEVKGYPSKFHVNTEKKGSEKTTKPKQQAKHWFSEVIMSCIYNYGKFKDKFNNIQLAVGLPNNETNLTLIKKVSDFFIDFKIHIKIYLVSKNGAIDEIDFR